MHFDTRLGARFGEGALKNTLIACSAKPERRRLVAKYSFDPFAHF